MEAKQESTDVTLTDVDAVGPARADDLREHGIETVRELAEAPAMKVENIIGFLPAAEAQDNADELLD